VVLPKSEMERRPTKRVVGDRGVAENQVKATGECSNVRILGQSGVGGELRVWKREAKEKTRLRGTGWVQQARSKFTSPRGFQAVVVQETHRSEEVGELVEKRTPGNRG